MTAPQRVTLAVCAIAAGLALTPAAAAASPPDMRPAAATLRASAETVSVPSTPAADTSPTPGGAETTSTPRSRTLRVGTSVRGRPIWLTRFGQGDRRVLIIGGIHGDEAGTRVARAFVTYLVAHPSAIPSGTELDIVACANPDGFAAQTRGNSRRVDLNRNFPARTWRFMRWGRLTSGRRAASEPETRVIVRLLSRRYARVVSLHSKAGWVDGSGRGGSVLGRRIARAAGVRYGDPAPTGSYPGSLGTYAPERYPATASVCWELTSRRMTTPVLRGLLAAVR